MIGWKRNTWINITCISVGLWYRDTEFWKLVDEELKKRIFPSPILYRMMYLYSFLPADNLSSLCWELNCWPGLWLRLVSSFLQFLGKKMFYSQSLRFLMLLFKGLKIFLAQLPILTWDRWKGERFRTETIWKFHKIPLLIKRKWNILWLGGLGVTVILLGASVFCNSM